MHGKNYRKWIYTTIPTKILQASRPSEAWSPSYCLLITEEDVQIVCLDSSWRHRRNQTLVTILSCTTSDWRLFTTIYCGRFL